MRVGVLCSRIRVEEKMLFDALERRGVPNARKLEPFRHH